MRSPRLWTKFWQVSKGKKAYVYVHIHINIYFNAKGFIFFQSEISSLEILRITRDCIYRDSVIRIIISGLWRIRKRTRGRNDLSGWSIILINEREGEGEKKWSKSITFGWWIAWFSVLAVTRRAASSIIAYIARSGGVEKYTWSNTRACTRTSQVGGGHATRIAQLVRREFSIKFPVSRGETEIRGNLD